ncbi:hypothetical protein [Streptomyces canus]
MTVKSEDGTSWTWTVDEDMAGHGPGDRGDRTPEPSGSGAAA